MGRKFGDEEEDVEMESDEEKEEDVIEDHME